jgi:hypothetical protein
MTRVSRASSRRPSRRFVLGAALAAIAVSGAVPARAAEAELTLTLSNAYIWRGITFNDSGVGQFSLDVGELKLGSVPLSFNVWGNLDIGDFDGALAKGRFSEIDLTVEAGLPSGFAVGYIEYLFPAGVASTRELYASWSKELVVTPTLTLYYDVGEVDDFYATAELGYSYALNEKTSLDLGGLVALAGADFAKAYGGEKGGFYNYDLSAGISYQAKEKLSVAGKIGWAGSLDKAVLPKQPLGFYGAADVSIGF